MVNGWSSFVLAGTVSFGLYAVMATQCPAGSGHPRMAVGAICAGLDFTCSLGTNGTVTCFGDGSYGQLGSGNPGVVKKAFSASQLEFQAASIACGGSHACGISVDGDLFCWGDGSKGQLGKGNTENVGDDEIASSVGAVALGSGVSAKQVVAGLAHTCALTVAGNAVCFGEGSSGQLGLGSTDKIGDDELPSSAGSVDVGGEEIVQLAAGNAHTCSLFVSGKIGCWGLGAMGQLGNGATDNLGDDEALNGNLVYVELGTGRTAKRIYAGGNRVCAVLDDASGICWGEGGAALGFPQHSGNLGDDEEVASAGTLDFGGSGVASFALSAGYTCAVLEVGTGVCWGLKDAPLGQMRPDDISSPASSFLLGVGAPLLEIAAGHKHACAVTTDNAALCWGCSVALGREGEISCIGDDELPFSAGKTIVHGVNPSTCLRCNRGFSQLDIQDSDEDVVCERCPLGHKAINGSTCEQCEAGSVPTSDGLDCQICDASPMSFASSAGVCDKCPGDKVPDVNRTNCVCPSGSTEVLSSATAVCVGTQITCVLHGLYVSCWGYGQDGSLGLGPDFATVGRYESPIDAGTLNFGVGVKPVELTCNGMGGCIITSQGNVMCWGSGLYGKLGYGNTEHIGDDEVPADAGVVNLGAGVKASKIAAGGSHTCVIITSGDVMCWGWGALGALGYGNTENIGDDEDPADAGVVNLGSGVKATSISAGTQHTCVITDDGDVMCWGASSGGKLGYGNYNYVGNTNHPFEAGVVNLGTGVKASKISAGDGHTCAITDDGDVMCWGAGYNGNLGYGNTVSIGNTNEPVDAGVVNLGAGVTATTITAGKSHTCAVTSIDSGSVMCWGFAWGGRLGYGNSDTIGDDEDPADAGVVNLGSGVTATDIAAEEITCAITSLGVKCWGPNSNGLLGYGNTASVGDDEDPADVGVVLFGYSFADCEQCDAGFFPDTTSTPHICTPCVGAAISNSGDASCTPCDTDEASISNTCTTCGNGEVPSADGKSCVQCAEGEYEESAGTCSVCAVGSVSAAGSTSCTACDGSGEYTESASACGTCEGDLEPNTDRTECVCASGFGRASISSTDCEQCDAGFFPDTTSTPHICTPCVGAAISNSGDASCTPCDTDEASISNTCTTCGNGEVPSADGKSCVQCAEGEYEESAGTCSVCAVGSVSAAGSTSCTACDGSGEYTESASACGTCEGDLEPNTNRTECVCASGFGRVPFASIAVCGGLDFTCVITDTNDVVCWGNGRTGRLGYGNEDAIGDTEEPWTAGTVNLGDGVTATDIACGFVHVCVIIDSGDVMCWGSGSNGALGYGNTDTIGDDEDPADAGAVNLGSGVSATSITAGEYYTCVITNSADVMCWGYGNKGQLGYGNTESIGDDEDPAEAGVVNLGSGVTATSVSAYEEHTCVITDSKDVMCWGEGSLGRLGYGNEDDIGDDEDPATVGVVNLGAGVSISIVSVANSHTCAVSEEGDTYCWGKGERGRLGYGNEENIGDDEDPADAGPVDLGTGVVATTLSSGAYHNCIVSDDGAVYCWGLGVAGTLGYGDQEDIGAKEVPGDVGPVKLKVAVETLACGGQHVCVISQEDNELICWGNGGNGRLGYASTTHNADTKETLPNKLDSVKIGFKSSDCELCSGVHVADHSVSPHRCIRCPYGLVNPSGEESCSSCTGSTFYSEVTESCIACLDGAKHEMNLGCTMLPRTCEADQVETEAGGCETCQDDSYADWSVDECVVCGPGKVLNDANNGCDLCPQGTDESSLGECSACAAGYVSAAGSPSCTECDGVDEVASLDQSECVTCDVGFIPNSDHSACTECSAGLIEESSGSCTSCSGMDVIADSSTQTCKKCGAGMVPADTGDECEPCPGGTIESPKGSCDVECNAFSNSYSPAGSTTCSRCTFMLNPTTDRSECIAPCNSVDCGSKGICYLDVSNEATCACGLGQAVSDDGQSCENAPSSKPTCRNDKQDGDETDVDCGGGKCNACPIGFYCDSTASCQSGLVCEKDASSPAGGTCAPDLIKRGVPLFVDRIELNGLGSAQIRLAGARLIAEAFRRGLTDLTQAVVDSVDMSQVKKDVEGAGRRLQAIDDPGTAELSFVLTFNSSSGNSDAANDALVAFLADPHQNNTSPLALAVKDLAHALFLDRHGLLVIGTRKATITERTEVTDDTEPETIEYEDLSCNGKDEYKGSTGCRDCGDGKIPNDDNDGCIECLRGESDQRGVCANLASPLEAGIIAVIVIIAICAPFSICLLYRRHQQSVKQRRQRLQTKQRDVEHTKQESNPMRVRV